MSDAKLSDFASRLCPELKVDSSHMTLKEGTMHGCLILPEWQGDHVLWCPADMIRPLQCPP